MSDLIMTKEGKPFETEQAANLRMGVLKKTGVETQPVEVDGGFALQKIEPEKKKRVPLGTRNRLSYPERKGYHRRVFNDDHDRIQRALGAGYEFVTESGLTGGDPRAGDASQMGAKVSKQVGFGTTGYLMEIPDEYYNEDQKAKQERLNLQEAQMKRERTDGVTDLYGKVQIDR